MKSFYLHKPAKAGSAENEVKWATVAPNLREQYKKIRLKEEMYEEGEDVSEEKELAYKKKRKI